LSHPTIVPTSQSVDTGASSRETQRAVRELQSAVVPQAHELIQIPSDDGTQTPRAKAEWKQRSRSSQSPLPTQSFRRQPSALKNDAIPPQALRWQICAEVQSSPPTGREQSAEKLIVSDSFASDSLGSPKTALWFASTLSLSPPSKVRTVSSDPGLHPETANTTIDIETICLFNVASPRTC